MGKTSDDTDLLLKLTSDADLFCTKWGEPYVDCVSNGVRHTYPLRSDEFEGWLGWRFYRETGRAIRQAPMLNVLAALSARALMDSNTHSLFLRVANAGDKLYLDLANDRGEVVEITSMGWKLVTECPVRFRRPRGLAPLPKPAPNGHIGLLRPFLGNIGDCGFALVVGWLLNILNGPLLQPILIFTGPQESAKSFATKFTRSILDPHIDPLSSLPTTTAEFGRAINKGLIQAWDNISQIKPSISDTLCRISTGGFDCRYTPGVRLCDSDTRPMMLNGIVEFVERPDLAARALFVPLRPIERQLTSKELDLRFSRDWPKILGALLDAAVYGLAGGKALTKPVGRFVDMEQWVSRCEAKLTLQQKFSAAYAESKGIADDALADADPLCGLLVGFIEERGSFIGTPTDFWAALKQRNVGTRSLPRFPGSAAILSSRLNRLTPILKRQGITITPDRGGQKGTRSMLVQRESSLSAVPPEKVKTVRAGAKETRKGHDQLSLALADDTDDV